MSDLEVPPKDGGDRRGFLSSASSWLMLGGLATGYGACTAMGARYLFPARPAERRWLFVAPAASIADGASLAYKAPSGESIAIARSGNTGTVEDFVALSSTCPHLGCQVHWEGQNERFFCPCHNGVFAPDGVAISGPPAEANQSLGRYPLKIDAGRLFIEVPVTGVAQLAPREGGAPPGPGHDPCLYPDRGELA